MTSARPRLMKPPRNPNCPAPIASAWRGKRPGLSPQNLMTLSCRRIRPWHLDGAFLGKPENEGEAAEFLLALSGRRHRVMTAVAVRRGDQIWERDVVTAVKMKRLSDEELNAYLASNDWQGKAGGYGIQGPAGALIPWIEGSFTAVVGLPLAETANLLRAAGYPLYKDTA